MAVPANFDYSKVPLSAPENLLCSLTASCVAETVTYPFEVAKVRLQIQGERPLGPNESKLTAKHLDAVFARHGQKIQAGGCLFDKRTEEKESKPENLVFSAIRFFSSSSILSTGAPSQCFVRETSGISKILRSVRAKRTRAN